MMKIPIMSYAINLTFQLLVWLVPGGKFYGLGTGFQFQTFPVPLYVLNPMGLLWFPLVAQTFAFSCRKEGKRRAPLEFPSEREREIPDPEMAVFSGDAAAYV